MLNAQNLVLSFGERNILDKASFSLLKGQKLALVGDNGAGKSTLLKVLAGADIEGGSIEVSKGAIIQTLSQEPNLDLNLTVSEAVEQMIAPHKILIQEYESWCQKLSSAKELSERETLSHKISQTLQKIEAGGGFELSYVVDTVLDKLSIRNKNRPLKTLSGGERRRVDLARVLLQPADIYLLDEPTNHLDFTAIKFITERFKTNTAPLLFISHDVAFINELATGILELNKGKIYSHPPLFANYLENKLVRELIEKRSLHKKERLLVQELSWLRAGTPARTTKQNARIDRAYELINQVDHANKEEQKASINILLQNKKRLGKTILELDQVGAKYDDHVLFSDFSLKVSPGSRYGILGRNGIGKSTLLSIISGERPPDFGQVKYGKNTKVLQFDQHRKSLELNKTIQENLTDEGDFVFIGERKVHIASYLEQYLFAAGDAKRKVNSLSGGEQNRLVLAKLFQQSSNCLLMDEPTNDLDVASLAVLQNLLSTYPGVIFIVSHDRNFLEQICTHIIAFEESGNGKCQLFVHTGGYKEYERFVASKRQIDKKKVKTVEKFPQKPKEKKLSYKEKEELKNMESSIEELEEQKEKILADLSSSEVFNNHLLAQDKASKLQEIEEEIEQKYSRWQELQDKAYSH